MSVVTSKSIFCDVSMCSNWAGETVISFIRYRVPEHDVEISIYGEDGMINVASHYMCEKCADVYLSMNEMGYCNSPY